MYFLSYNYFIDKKKKKFPYEGRKKKKKNSQLQESSSGSTWLLCIACNKVKKKVGGDMEKKAHHRFTANQNLSRNLSNSHFLIFS